MKERILWMRILNALVVAGITFVSTLSVSFPPTVYNLYSAFIAFALTFLVQIKAIINDLEKCKGPKGGKKEEEKECGQRSLFMMII